MGKDTRLINIYLKIHNKKALTLDDLNYLAEYDPECFEKTFSNVVYNIPEIKSVIEPDIAEALDEEPESQLSERQMIEKILENLKRMERNDIPVVNIDAEKVKSLLGNLYMELLFPHNDKPAFMNMAESGRPVFDKKA